MITRRQVRRGLLWVGLGCGVAGVLVYITSMMFAISCITPTRKIVVGAGAIAMDWGTSNELYAPKPGAARITDWSAEGVEKDWEPSDGVFSVGETWRFGGGEFPWQQTESAYILTRQGWFPAVRTEQAQWRIVGSGHQFYPHWRWYPRLREAGGHPGNLTVPAWLLILAGLVSIYYLLPPDTNPGTCRRCGFDLSRTPPLPGDTRGGTRCPECGLISRVRSAPDASAAAPPIVSNSPSVPKPTTKTNVAAPTAATTEPPAGKTGS